MIVWKRITDINGVVTQEWDDSGVLGTPGTFTDFTTTPATTRPYTADEQARADSDLQAATASTNATQITTALMNAINSNVAWLAAHPAPTGADIVAEFPLLLRQVTAIERLLFRQLNSTSGT